MNRMLAKPLWIVGLLSASGMLSACVAGDTLSLETAQEQKLLGQYSNLTATEWQTYRQDMKTLRRMVKPNTAIRLNLADASQYRFALTRLRIAGKTPTNSPYLFESLQRTRDEHVRLGYGSRPRPDALYANTLSGPGSAMHYITSAKTGASAGEGAASSTFPGGTAYTLLDVAYYDGADVPLGNPNIIEQFGGGKDVNVRTVANLGQTQLDSYAVDTFQLQDDGVNFDSSYTYTDIGLRSAQPANGRPTRPTLAVSTIVDPTDRRLNDNLISICLNRTWTQDCDYDLTGNPQAVKVPLQGSIQITSAHVFHEPTINQIRADLTNGVPNALAGYVKLILTNAGGGCDVGADGALQTSMKAFWDSVTVTNDASGQKKILSWNLSGANAAFFDDGCRQVQDVVKLTMRLLLPVRDPVYGLDFTVSVTLSNDGAEFEPNFVFKPMRMVNSCLAAGTEIRLADGKETAIEKLSAGDQVFNSLRGGEQFLTVTDTATGFETVPMVRLRADSGHSVLMTEMHPVQTPDRGIVLAKDLKEGDQVITLSGASKLVQVSREAFDGNVYNLKLGTEAEQSSLGADQTLLYANGFLVGDGQIQSKYESLAMAKDDGDVLARLPKQWHRDYHMSPLRK